MILSAQTIREHCVWPAAVPEPENYAPMIEPFCERTVQDGMTFGLGPAGYDVRLDNGMVISHGHFELGSTIEQFNMPNNVMAVVHDKSTWARQGVAVQNTVIEPGWRGFLTLEISYHDTGRIYIQPGAAIAQIVFQFLDRQTEQPYSGRYNNQPAGPQPAKFIEREDVA